MSRTRSVGHPEIETMLSVSDLNKKHFSYNDLKWMLLFFASPEYMLYRKLFPEDTYPLVIPEIRIIEPESEEALQLKAIHDVMALPDPPDDEIAWTKESWEKDRMDSMNFTLLFGIDPNLKKLSDINGPQPDEH